MIDLNDIRYVYSEYLKDWFHLIAFAVDDCNYNCDFCYNIKPRTKTILDLDRLMAFIQQIHEKTHKKIFLEILGGEPTLHPGLLDFCNKLNRQHKYVKTYVFTNFSKDIEYYLNLLKNNIALSITWHSKHNDITGQSFIKKAKHIPIKYFKSPGIRLRILYEKNNTINALNAFDELFPQHKEYIEFDLLSDISQHSYEYSYEELLEFNNRISKLKPATQNDYVFEHKNGEKELLKFTDIVKQSQFNFNKWLCNAGKDCLYIHSNGDAYPCESYYFATASNVFNGKIYNIYSHCYDLQKHGILCRCTQCAWSWNIYKNNIFIK